MEVRFDNLIVKRREGEKKKEYALDSFSILCDQNFIYIKALMFGCIWNYIFPQEKGKDKPS